MKRLACLCIWLCTAQVALAQFDYGFDFSKAGSAGFQFLKIGVGARESALGNAATSLSNDANAVFWNVGALGFVENRQVLFTHNEWLVNSDHNAAAVALPFGSYVVGLSLAQLSIEEFEETTVLEPFGTGRMVSAGDLLFGISVAKKFTNRLSIGAQVKLVQESLDNDSFSNILFDVGTIYYTGFRHLRLAFTFQHFGPDIKILRQKFRMPLLFRISVAEDIVFTAKQRLTTAFDVVHPTDNNEWVNWGIEYEYLNLLALRAGYRINVDEGNLSLGAGLRMPKLGSLNLKVDYAYVRFGEIFGTTHRFSIGFAF